MIARWDALLLAIVVAGGSMLIENSHRLDTGAPDDDIVAISACSDDQAVVRYSQTNRVPTDGDDGSDNADAETTPASASCPTE